MRIVQVTVALVFAGLYAALLLQGLITRDWSGPVVPLLPLVTFVLTFLLGRETLAALRRRQDNAGE
jgi:hypothetical protein